MTTSNIPAQFSSAPMHQGADNSIIQYQSVQLNTVPGIMVGLLWKGMLYSIPSMALSPQFKTGTEALGGHRAFGGPQPPPNPPHHRQK